MISDRRCRFSHWCCVLTIESSARGIEIWIVIADPRWVEALIEIRAGGRRECGLLHLIIGAAIVPESVDRPLWGDFVLCEDRARECSSHDSYDAENLTIIRVFPSLRGETLLKDASWCLLASQLRTGDVPDEALHLMHS